MEIATIEEGKDSQMQIEGEGVQWFLFLMVMVGRSVDRSYINTSGWDTIAPTLLQLVLWEEYRGLECQIAP